MTLSERAEKAVELKNSGRYNCAQSVTAALADQTKLSEEDLKEMLTFANAAASIITTRRGALRVMPEPHEVEELIRTRS